MAVIKTAMGNTSGIGCTIMTYSGGGSGVYLPMSNSWIKTILIVVYLLSFDYITQHRSVEGFFSLLDYQDNTKITLLHQAITSKT